MQLFLDSARGQYIPRDFARTVKRDAVSGIDLKDLDYLAHGPGGCLDESETLQDGETERGEFYWDTWQTVLDNCTLTDDKGNRFTLYQDGDLWLVPADWEWIESLQTFGPAESESLVRFELYSHWASHLINGDASGLDDKEQAACDAFLKRESLEEWTCADVSERTWFGAPDCGGLRGDIALYTFVLIQHQTAAA